MKKTLFAVLAAALVATTPAFAAPIFVPGPLPVAPFGGTVIDFEGLAEGQLIDTEFAGLGVTFTQDDGGTPMIDNLPQLFGFGPGSGLGMLTGSTTGGAPFPTVAGLIGVFTTPVARAGAFFSDTAPLGDYIITAFDVNGVVLESFILLGSAIPSGAVCGSILPTAPGCGVFVGFDVGANLIGSIQFGPSGAAGDAFSIDDFRFEAVTTAVPEPGTFVLLGLGLVGVGALRRRR